MQKCVNHDNPQSREVLRADLIHPQGSTAVEMLNYLSDFCPRDRMAHFQDLRLCYLLRICAGGIEEVLPLSDYTPS